MGSRLFPKGKDLKPHSEKVVRPWEVLSMWGGGDIPSQGAEIKMAEPWAYLPEVWRRSPPHRSLRSPHSRSPRKGTGRSPVGIENPPTGREGSLWGPCTW